MSKTREKIPEWLEQELTARKITLTDEQMKLACDESFQNKLKDLLAQYEKHSLLEVLSLPDDTYAWLYESDVGLTLDDFSLYDPYPICKVCGRGGDIYDNDWNCEFANTPECAYLDDIKTYINHQIGLPGVLMCELDGYILENKKLVSREDYDRMWDFLTAKENEKSIKRFVKQYKKLPVQKKREWLNIATDDITAIFRLAETK